MEGLIDAGTHGQVFEGTDTITLKPIAVKIVPEAKLKRKTFIKEINTIKRLNEATNNFGFTQLILHSLSNKYNYYIMDKLGNSLKVMRSLVSEFTMENVIMVGIQVGI